MCKRLPFTINECPKFIINIDCGLDIVLLREKNLSDHEKLRLVKGYNISTLLVFDPFL